MNLEVSHELRLCKVRDELGYFHTWEYAARPLEASPFRGGAPAGQFSKINGIVEFSNRVERVDPTDIIFCDTMNSTLNTMREAHEKEKLQDAEDRRDTCLVL